MEACLKINRNFSEARDAIRKLEGSEPLDWYSWWFGHVDKDNLGVDKDEKRRKKRNTFKPILAAIVIAAIALLIILIVILAFINAYALTPSVAAALSLPELPDCYPSSR